MKLRLPDLTTTVVLFLAWLLLAAITTPLLTLLSTLRATLSTFLVHIRDGLRAAVARLNGALDSLQDDIRGVGLGIAEALEPGGEGLDALVSALQAHWTRVFSAITQSSRYPAHRMLGAIVYLVALVLFLWADLALGLAALESISTGAGIQPEKVPPFLRSLTVPLMISFGLNAFILFALLFDMLGITDFSGWPTKRPRVMYVLTLIVITNIAAVLVLGLFFVLGRVVELARLQLDPRDQALFQLLATFASQFITVPALITTGFLSRAKAGIFALWMWIVGLFIVLLAAIRWLVRWSQRAAPLTANGTAMLVGWFIAFVYGLLNLTAWLAEIVDNAQVAVTSLLERILVTITYVPRELWRWLTSPEVLGGKLRLTTGSVAPREPAIEGVTAGSAPESRS